MTQVAFCQYVLPHGSYSNSIIDVYSATQFDVFIHLIKTVYDICCKYLCSGIDSMGLLAIISLFVVLGQSILQFQAQCNLSSPTQRATLNHNHSKMDLIQVPDGLWKICLRMPILESEKCHFHASLGCASF